MREGVDLGTELAQRPDQLGAARLVALVDDLDHGERASAQRLGDVGQRRQAQDACRRGGGVGGGVGPAAVAVENVGAALDREDEPAGVDLGERVEVELDRGDHAEAPAAAAQRPEHVGVALAVGTDVASALRGDELDRRHAVRREAVAAREPADAAAERVADDADVPAHRAEQRREAVARPRRASRRPRARRPRRRATRGRGVDPDAAHARAVFSRMVAVERAQRRRAVAGALRRDHAASLPARTYDLDDVLGIGPGSATAAGPGRRRGSRPAALRPSSRRRGSPRRPRCARAGPGDQARR